jgi:hypothetical protein
MERKFGGREQDRLKTRGLGVRSIIIDLCRLITLYVSYITLVSSVHLICNRE